MSIAELVSVVIPTHNRCNSLLSAIASVRIQAGVEFEIIVVDDASSDDTEFNLISLCREESRLRFVRNEAPLGGGGARNVGASLARGEFIAFLDDDDCFLPSKLSQQVVALRKRPDACAASCSFLVYSGDRQSKLRRVRAPRARTDLLRANVLGGASVCMVRADSFREVGGFDSRLTSCQDWDLWLKLHSVGNIVVCDEPLVRYNFHTNGQITGNVVAEYQGRRSIHLRFLSEMSEEVRRGSLAALIFDRRVRRGRTVTCRFSGLVWALRLAPRFERITFIWRTIRLVFRRKITQT